MKIKGKFILKKILNDYIVVPVGDDLLDFNAAITLNETGAFLWEKLQEPVTAEEICSAICTEYDVDKETAAADVEEFVKNLDSAGILCYE